MKSHHLRNNQSDNNMYGEKKRTKFIIKDPLFLDNYISLFKRYLINASFHP